MILHKPDNYDENRAKTLLDAAGEKEDKSEEEVDITQRPNIIAIMNESFSDLSVVGDFETEEDYMPFIRSFTDNTVKGQLLVSPFGGNTCNTEFEFMTGLSMGLVPTGSTPYMQYITKEFPLSLPAHLSDLGYKTVAVHPYSGKCWNRLKVYGLFRFEKFISIENLNEYIDEGDWEYIRNYLSDNTSFKAVTKQLEEKSDDERMFIFNVTMQNHGGYDYNDTPFEGLHITNMKGEYPETEQYLAAIRETDKAYENLINYLKDFDEPTIVLMFGDHQPAVEQEFFEELYGQSLDDVDLEDLQKRYTIPFIIWANYDIEDKAGVKTSPNYLSNLLLDTAGVPKNELGMFTEEISESIPQLNVMGHYDSDGVWSVNDISSTALLKDYEDVEYYLLTRKEN
jgi:phosphoglycerol transferase MdoB-like AlkP superfamily enzyme